MPLLNARSGAITQQQTSIEERDSSFCTSLTYISQIHEVDRSASATSNWADISTPDLFDVFIREKVYLDYAQQFLAPEQIDNVDLGRIPGVNLSL